MVTLKEFAELYPAYTKKAYVPCVGCEKVSYITHSPTALEIELTLHHAQLCDHCFFTEIYLDNLKW